MFQTKSTHQQTNFLLDDNGIAYMMTTYISVMCIWYMYIKAICDVSVGEYNVSIYELKADQKSTRI